MVAVNPLNFGNSNNMRPAQGNSSSINRAQNFSTSSLQQKRDRSMASTSIVRALNRDSGLSPTTSIGRVGQQYQKSTSVFHNAPEESSVYGDGNTDEIRDRLRYQHIRQSIRDRKEAENNAVMHGQVSKYDLGVKTGGAFKTKGKGTFAAKLKKLRRANPDSFKNLSNKDLKYFSDMVSPHAKVVRRGTGISRSVRKDMKQQIEQSRRSGDISKADSGSFKKIIDNLPH